MIYELKQHLNHYIMMEINPNDACLYVYNSKRFIFIFEFSKYSYDNLMRHS